MGLLATGLLEPLDHKSETVAFGFMREDEERDEQ